MFNRTSLTSIYRVYTKCKQGLQNYVPKGKFNKNFNASSRILLQYKKYKDEIYATSSAIKFSTTLSYIQDKFTSQGNVTNKDAPLKGTASTTTVAATSTITEPFSEPPPLPSEELPEAATEIIDEMNDLDEPAPDTLGLDEDTTVGFAQAWFEYLGIPSEAMVLVTVIRFLLFPMVVIAQRNAEKINKYMPQMQTLQLKIAKARQIGNQLEVAKYSQKMMLFMKKKQLNLLKNKLGTETARLSSENSENSILGSLAVRDFFFKLKARTNIKNTRESEKRQMDRIREDL